MTSIYNINLFFTVYIDIWTADPCFGAGFYISYDKGSSDPYEFAKAFVLHFDSGSFYSFNQYFPLESCLYLPYIEATPTDNVKDIIEDRLWQHFAFERIDPNKYKEQWRSGLSTGQYFDANGKPYYDWDRFKREEMWDRLEFEDHKRYLKWLKDNPEEMKKIQAQKTIVDGLSETQKTMLGGFCVFGMILWMLNEYLRWP